jgi:hypothetical protein
MFEKESIWIGNELEKIFKEERVASLLNIGSSTKTFREKEQPFIYRNIFRPIPKTVLVTHLDMKAADGVDMVGDLSDTNFLFELAKTKYDLILCSNLLEHVRNPREICSALSQCVSLGGFIIITIPYLYPYHNDPIDTMYRPTPQELAALFPFNSMHSQEILSIEDSHFRLLMRNRVRLLLFVVRIFIPFYKPLNWLKIVSDIPNLFKLFKVTCLVMRN